MTGDTSAPPPLPGTTEQPAGAPPPLPPRPAARPLVHTTEATKTYPCESCGGELKFDPASQQLACEHCGTSFDISEVGSPAAERDLREALRLIREGKHAHTSEMLAGDKEIVCQNCGGHTTFSGSLTADNCPYCLTPIQRDDVHAAPDRLPVDAVVPFAIDQKQANDLAHRWINKRWFTPNEFKTYSRTGSLQSVYAAYFTYDADTSTSYRGERGDEYTVRDGDDKRTEIRWRRVTGTVANNFDDLTVFANTGMDAKRIAKLEPWPTESAKPFAAEYVAGHLCRTYDRDVEECFGDATKQIESEIRSTIKRDIGGDRQKIHSMSIEWTTMTYRHLLMPIWLLTVIYLQQPYQVYINGVTGEVHGARPYSKVKIIAAIAAVVALIVLIAVLVAVLRG